MRRGKVKQHAQVHTARTWLNCYAPWPPKKEEYMVCSCQEAWRWQKEEPWHPLGAWACRARILLYLEFKDRNEDGEQLHSGASMRKVLTKFGTNPSQALGRLRYLGGACQRKLRKAPGRGQMMTPVWSMELSTEGAPPCLSL